MKRIIIALVLSIFLHIAAEAQAQIRLLDNYSQQPIEYASIFDAKGKLLTTSNDSGYFSLGKNVHQLSISHVAYINKDVDIDTLKGKTIYLNLREQALNEVSVTTKKPEFVVLEAYFRATQFYNGLLEYYYDGVAYYFVKLKNGNVDHYVFASRFLVDDSVKKVEYKKGSMFSYVPPIPVPGFYSLDKGNKAKNEVFRIDTLSSKVRYSFDHLYPDTVKRFKFGRYYQQLKKSYSSEVYSKNPDGVSYTDFLSGRGSRQMVVGYKEARKVYDQWEEVYITKAFFANKQELNNLKKDMSKKFEIDQYLEQYAIPPISNSIKAKLSEMKVSSR